MAESQRSKYRPRRSREAWQQSIEDWRSSGLSQTAFCERHDLAPSTFQWWHHRLAEEPPPEPEPSEPGGFVEVRVGPEPELSSDAVELLLPSGLRLSVPRGWNRGALVEILHALKEVGSC